MSQVQLNIDELKGFLGHMVRNNQFIQAQGKVPVAVNIEGDAGLGKTSSLMQLAVEMDMAVIKLNLSQIEELGDLVGFPFKEFDKFLRKRKAAISNSCEHKDQQSH